MANTRFVLRIAMWAFITLVGITTTFVLVVVGLFYAAMPLSNLTLWRMEQTLASITHPTNSHTLERKTFLGSRYTDQSECTYAVGEFRSTSLSPYEILHTYERSSIPTGIIIIDKNTSLPLDNPADNWITDFRKTVGQNKSDVTYYLIYLYKKGKPWWGDIRCYS